MELKDYTNAQYDFTMALKIDKNDKKKQSEYLSKNIAMKLDRLCWIGTDAFRKARGRTCQFR